MKPMLASDAVLDLAKLKFPLGIQPKIDGVRALNLFGRLTGRSLKEHKNRYTTALYSHPHLLGFDGEMAANHECHPDLCRLTSSALGTIEGEPFTLWWLFDTLTADAYSLPYKSRYEALVVRVRELATINPPLWQHLRVVPMLVVHNLEELVAQEEKWLAEGYEGLIIRDLNGMHKSGRSTVREMGLLRVKRFIEVNARVLAIEEGRTNMNEAKLNKLGLAERSSHQENMVPNGMVGSLTCQLLEDINDPFTKKQLFENGKVITVAPGKMSNDEAKNFLCNPSLILQKVIKLKFFPKGIKDKPRFPTYQYIVPETDL